MTSKQPVPAFHLLPFLILPVLWLAWTCGAPGNEVVRAAWKGSQVELEIATGEGNDHFFEFTRLDKPGFPMVYSGFAQGPPAGPLVYEESGPVDGRNAVRIEIRPGERDLTVGASPMSGPDGVEIDLSGAYGIVTVEARFSHAEAAHEKADQLLNDRYRALRASLKPEEAARLRTAQLEWIQYRDGVAEQTADADNPESSVRYFRALASLTAARTELLSIWDGWGVPPGLDGDYIDGYGGSLSIRDAGPESFAFAIFVVRGPTAHTGEIEGIAKRNGQKAIFTDADLPPDERSEDPCRITFTIIGNRIEVDGENTHFYHGARRP